MTTLKKISLGIAFCFPLFIAQAQTKKATPVKAVTAAKTTAPVKVTSVEGITEYKLSNGLRVLLFPDPSKPTATVNITYLVGSRHEGLGETGMAHLLEHMVFKGTPKHPNIPAELTAHGASPNGTTWYDRTNYFETFNATDENLNWALDLEADRMINSYIAAKDLKSEFTVVRNEFESGENNPSGILMERILSSAYLWHNYGKSTIGSKEDIEKVPIQNLQAFYKKYYQPDNAVLLVAGKIDEAKTLALVQKYFGNIPKPTRVLQPTYTIEPVQDGTRYVELSRVGDIQSIAAAYHVPSASHPDYAAIDVLSEALTNEPGGRLYESLVKTGKASSTNSFIPTVHDPGYIYISVDVLKEKSLEDAKNTLFTTLNEIKTKPITEAEVDRYKTKLLKGFETRMRNSASLGIELTEYIGAGDWRLAFLYRDALEKLTAADVNRVANAYIKSSNLTYGQFIPSSNIDRANIPQNPDLAATLANYKGKAAMSAGEAFDPSPENIMARSKAYTAPSGAKYTFLPKSTRGEVVEGRITYRIGDEKSLTNKGAVSELTAAMLRLGTTKYTRQQLNDELDKLKSSVAIGGGGQNVSISIQSTKANLPAVLDMVNDMIHNPAFNEAEFKTMVDEQIAGLEQGRSEPQSIASRAFGRIGNNKPKGHPLYAATLDEDLEELKAVKIDDLKSFYKNFYTAKNATAAFVGDFDADVVKPKLEQILGGLNGDVVYKRIENGYQSYPPQILEFKTPDKKNAMAMGGYPVQIKDSNADYPALLMADFILGGGFLNSRLATRIRQKEGISYGVGSQFGAPVLDDKGMIFTYAIYNPENKQKLMSAYKEEYAKFVKDGITETELKDAKNAILQYRLTGRGQDAGLANRLNNMLFLNRTMTWEGELDKKLESLTAAQVNEAIKKYYDFSKMSFVNAGDYK